jgi:integrative and conjugative element protein (TIGR02256 family)
MPTEPIYRHIFVVETVLNVFRDESRHAGWRETGGPLIGYLSDDKAVVVTGAGGPGPRAQRRLTSVQIDGRHATSFCSQIYHQSNGSFDYIGDWHRHTLLSLKPSESDERAMLQMALSGSCLLEAPISLIYRRLPESMAVYVLNAQRRLCGVSHTLIDSVPK